MMRKLRALIQQPSFIKQTDFVIKGVPEKKYLSEISGPQIHVTIKGQPLLLGAIVLIGMKYEL